MVDLDAEAVDARRRNRSWRAGLDLRLVRDDSLIFGEHNGGHLNADRLCRRSPDRSRWPGASWAPTPLPMIRVHDLRHPCATRMLANGMSVKVVFERLGHMTTTITSELYVHLLPRMHAPSAAELRASVVASLETRAHFEGPSRDHEPDSHDSQPRTRRDAGSIECARGDLNPHVLADTGT